MSSNLKHIPYVLLDRSGNPVYLDETRLPAAASAAPRVDLTGPSSIQMAELAAVPSGLATAWNSGVHLKRGRKTRKLIPDGRIVAKAFDLVSSRPQPTLSSLEQGIQVTLSRSVQNAFACGTVANAYYGEYIAIQNLAGYAAYLSLFDQYRIDQIEVWLTPVAVRTNLEMGEFCSVVDLDDATAPTTYEGALQKQGSLSTSQQAGHYHKWKPHMAIASYAGAFTSYSNIVGGWIDSASPGVQHYGLKIAFQPSDEVVQFSYEVRAVVSFRGPGVP